MLILGILSILALSSGVALAIVQITARVTHKHMAYVIATVYPSALRLKEAEASFEHMKKRYQDAVLLEDREALVSADRDAEGVTTALIALRLDVAGSPEFIRRTETIQTQFADILARSRATYSALLTSNNNVSDDLQVQVASLAKDSNSLTSAMTAFDQALDAQGQTEVREIDTWSDRSRIGGWSLLVVALAGCAAVGWVLQFRVLVPLEHLAERMRNIAEGDGDLTGRVEMLRQDELGEVGSWFNVFISRIEQIIIRVTDNARTLAAAAEDLAQNVKVTASQSLLQQNQAMRITSSMGEISSAAQAISKTTQEAAQDARRAEQNAQTGGNTIRSSVLTIQSLLLANRATSAKIQELGRANADIHRIVDFIDQISTQASLLALNASIEAARAGTHGRGFAVLAAELRRLADNTGRSTKEISVVVHAIQDGTAEVVRSMHSTTHEVENGVRLAESAGEAMRQILDGSGALQEMVTQIASASSEQSRAALSVNDRLYEIADLGTLTTSMTTQAVTACDHLSHLAIDLNSLVKSFRVGESYGTHMVPEQSTDLDAAQMTEGVFSMD